MELVRKIKIYGLNGQILSVTPVQFGGHPKKLQLVVPPGVGNSKGEEKNKNTEFKRILQATMKSAHDLNKRMKCIF